jgi:hypothetical protein
LCCYANSGAIGDNNKNNNWQSWCSLIYDFGQKRLNGSTGWSAAEDGQVLPHFQQIVCVALMMPCPMAAVI